MITLIDDTKLFTCPYCLEILSSKKNLASHMWDFTVINERKKACRCRDCTKIWIQPKILTEERLDNLKRDFSKYPWDDIVNNIRYGKWDMLEGLGIKVDDMVKGNTFGYVIPKDGRKKNENEEDESGSGSESLSENSQDENSQDGNSQDRRVKEYEMQIIKKKKRKLGEGNEKASMITTLRTIHEEKRTMPPNKRTKIIHTDTSAQTQNKVMDKDNNKKIEEKTVVETMDTTDDNIIKNSENSNLDEENNNEEDNGNEQIKDNENCQSSGNFSQNSNISYVANDLNQDENKDEQIDKQIMIDQLREQLRTMDTSYRQLLQELQNRVDQLDEQNKHLQKQNEYLSKEVQKNQNARKSEHVYKEHKADKNNNNNNSSANININDNNNNKDSDKKIPNSNNQNSKMETKIALFGWAFNSYIDFKDLKECFSSWGIPINETGKIQFHVYANGTRRFISIEVTNEEKASNFISIILNKINEKAIKGITWAEIYKKDTIKNGNGNQIRNNFFIPKWNNRINGNQGNNLNKRYNGYNNNWKQQQSIRQRNNIYQQQQHYNMNNRYQRNIYQRNNYQRNNYQRNNYQRNNYQRNNFQRNNYQRNNFQRNNYQKNQYYNNGFQRNIFNKQFGNLNGYQYTRHRHEYNHYNDQNVTTNTIPILRQNRIPNQIPDNIPRLNPYNNIPKYNVDQGINNMSNYNHRPNLLHNNNVNNNNINNNSNNVNNNIQPRPFINTNNGAPKEKTNNINNTNINNNINNNIKNNIDKFNQYNQFIQPMHIIGPDKIYLNKNNTNSVNNNNNNNSTNINKIKCKILFLNIKGNLNLKLTKNSALKKVYHDEEPDFFGFCETHQNNLNLSNIILNGVITYQKPYKRNTTDNRGRPSNGMCIITKQNWTNITNHNQFSNNNIMTLIIHKYQLIIIFIYVPPNDEESNEEIITETITNLEKLINLFNILKYLIIIMGDFNARMLDTGDRKTNQNGYLLKRLCDIHHLQILNIQQAYKQRTYHNNKTEQETFSIIDYVIINTNNRWQDANPQIDILKVFTGSDHFPIKVKFDIQQNSIEEENEIPLPKIIISRDMTKLHKTIPLIRWRLDRLVMDIATKHYNSNQTYNELMWNIYDVLCRTNAIKILYTNEMNKIEPIHVDIRNTINIINICIKYNASTYLLKHNINIYEKQKDKIQKQELNKLIYKLQKNINNGNEKNFYDIIRKLQINKQLVIHDHSGKAVHRNREKCTLLGEYYQNLFKHTPHKNIKWENKVKEKVEEYLHKMHLSFDQQLDRQFEEEEITEVGKMLDRNKATFLDGIPNELIALLVKQIPKQFTNIINTICNDENLPHKLLITKMVSIPKKTIEQNGFMKKRGIEDNIIILRTILYNRKYIEKKHYYLTLLDIHKAFDSVWHDGILYKLIKIGVRGRLLRIIHSMLTQGHLMVTYDDCSFHPFKIDSGTGQGYSLSGPLFNLYINDIIKEIKKENIIQKMYNTNIPPCLLYADDIIIITGSPKDNNTILQTIHKYCNKWKLQINKDKSVIASNKKKIINETSIRDNPLQIQNTNNTIKYLGIIFDSITLSWKKHVDDRVEKANTAISQSHLIGVLGGGLDHSTQIKYYRSIIRPVIEFGLRIMLLGNSHLRKLNTMQQRALTIIIMKEEYQYVLTKIHRYAKNIKEGKKVPPAVNMEAFKILVDIDLLNYWYFPPTYLTEKEWKVMIKKKIYRKDYENDIRELENKIDNQPLLQVLKECNSDMEPGIPLINEIKKRIKDVDDEVLNKIIKVLSGNPKFSWKNGKENGITIRKWKSCIWCKKEWENPIQHVLYDCEVHLSVRNKIREEQKKDQEKIILNGIFSINGLAKFCKEAFKENAMI
ncbi:hypothetical protein RFI_09718 [Reticulomyxa filosa]|uniref:Reverse transcriptase domain-containing protein n=1 Tax=Reticulomyxa filosa TaxID=46433 RepID=X6NME9_RETFI|nr:hypothetical protein RFI_09718 [Reticulomyxa filosa]|eukprot:ETO27415.1 hypothetical protein RFI_09718 [Reticulomyxa filosa]